MAGDLVLADPRSVAKQLRSLADMVETGEVSRYSISQDKHSISFTADSADGTSRLIRRRHEINGLHRETSEHIQKNTSRTKRRQVVAALCAENLTQVEIAKRTMTSQKTVSNDIRWLKDHGKL